MSYEDDERMERFQQAMEYQRERHEAEMPFHYEWFVGTDELGRRCAGESRIVYEEGIRLWQAMGLRP